MSTEEEGRGQTGDKEKRGRGKSDEGGREKGREEGS